MMKLPRVLDLRNRCSCNIIVPNRRPLFPIFLAPGALNGANTVSLFVCKVILLFVEICIKVLRQKFLELIISTSYDGLSSYLVR